MRLTVVGGGWVSRREVGTPTAVASGPRLAVLPTGEVVCTFMTQPDLGVSGFVPMLTRSRDGGATWDEPVAVWPERARTESLFCSLSRARTGRLLLFGTSTRIDEPGESFWSEATNGLKANELVWAASDDGGHRWSDPRPIPMPFPGSAEAAGPLCATRTGRLVGCYSPYPTFDPSLAVERNRVAFVRSDDGGTAWDGGTMLRFDDPLTGAAEAWVVELSDGRLLGEAWNMSLVDGRDHPDAYALSGDDGGSWSPTRSTGIRGQAASLAALPSGRAVLAYNVRGGDRPGVRVAVAQPSPDDFGVIVDEPAWVADVPVQRGSAAGHDAWRDFAFGEPAVGVLPGERELLLVLWCVQPSGRGIRWVRLELAD